MGFREVTVIQVKEMLRLWLRGSSARSIGRAISADRETVKRYTEAALAEGLEPGGGEQALTDELLGAVVHRVRPGGPGVHGGSWRFCQEHQGFLAEQLKGPLTLKRVRTLLYRHTGVEVPYRTLHRFAVQELGWGGKDVTVRLEDCEPGQELQVDFGRLGMVDFDGQRRALWALVLTAVYSRHMFVWPTFEQTTEAVLDGCEAAWEFFGGVFKVMVPDNPKALVISADPLYPLLNDDFVEYSQSRGFVVDPARVRSPKDKARVERPMPYVRDAFFRGGTFHSLADTRRQAGQWCLEEAGLRIHGTTRRQPLEVFKAEEAVHLLPRPEGRYDLPTWHKVTVQRDHHLSVGKALYSVPTQYIGEKVTVRSDSVMVRVYHKGQVIKTHAKQAPGGRATDPNDYPEMLRDYATRDVVSLQAKASSHGEYIGTFAARLLEGPQPWSKMRHCYRLLGLVKRWGAERVEKACRVLVELQVLDLKRLERMLELALEEGPPPVDLKPGRRPVDLRFARPLTDFELTRPVAGEVSHELQ